MQVIKNCSSFLNKSIFLIYNTEFICLMLYILKLSFIFMTSVLVDISKSQYVKMPYNFNNTFCNHFYIFFHENMQEFVSATMCLIHLRKSVAPEKKNQRKSMMETIYILNIKPLLLFLKMKNEYFTQGSHKVLLERLLH